MRAPRRILAFLLLSLLLPHAVPAAPQHPEITSLSGGAWELARKVLEALGAPPPQGLNFIGDWQNLSSLSAVEFDQGASAFVAELRRRGVKVEAEARAAREVRYRLTLSENAPGYLWTAEIFSAPTRQVFMVEVPRAVVTRTPPPAPALVLRKQFVLSQPAPVLDLLFLPEVQRSETRLLLLEPERVVLYHGGPSGWQFDQEVLLQHERPWPRDLRGRLVETDQKIQAFLPGVRCTVKTAPAVQATCGTSADPWPIFQSRTFSETAPLSPDRNYFEAVALSNENPGGTTPRFFAAAEGIQDGSAYALRTLPDGRALFGDHAADSTATIAGWGSDVAAQKTECGRGWQVLATRPGDWTERDAVQAFEIVNRQAIPASPPVEFDGPVTALWAAGEGNSATAVVRNRKTGLYEAYTLSISCSQ